MEPEECRKLLFQIARDVRLPSSIRRGSGDQKEGRVPLSAREKIAQLESYLCLTAEARGQLEEARLWIHAMLNKLRDDWVDLQGWEMYLGDAKVKSATGPQIAAAKRKVDPELADGVAEGEYLIKRLSEQIRRLEHDDEVVSRLYTFIAGA